MAEVPDRRGVSRREFLKVAAGGVAGTALFTLGAGEVTSLLAAGSPPQVLIKDLKRSAFAQHLGEEFKIHIGPLESLEVSLARVSDIASDSAHSAALHAVV